MGGIAGPRILHALTVEGVQLVFVLCTGKPAKVKEICADYIPLSTTVLVLKPQIQDRPMEAVRLATLRTYAEPQEREQKQHLKQQNEEWSKLAAFDESIFNDEQVLFTAE